MDEPSSKLNDVLQMLRSARIAADEQRKATQAPLHEVTELRLDFERRMSGVEQLLTSIAAHLEQP